MLEDAGEDLECDLEESNTEPRVRVLSERALVHVYQTLATMDSGNKEQAELIAAGKVLEGRTG